jgi:hypothetical protein
MPYSLKQAAEATGKTKPTILRAIQTSKISATRHQVTNAWQIEPAELHRVYPALAESVAQQNNSERLTQDETGREITLLRRELQLKDEQMGAFREERQRERAQFEGTIDDLRQRLDSEGEERRRLTAILTDQRTKTPDVMVTPPPPVAPARPDASAVKAQPVTQPPAKEASWFRRMMGGGHHDRA